MLQWINDADLIYLISLLGYKMSILVLYLRLFSVNKTFKYVTWSMMFFVSGYLFSNFWTQIFGCSPREKYWLPETPGHCINYTKAGLAYGAMNFASDLFIFVLPLPTVWRLNLPVKEKVGVSLIFMSGAMYVDRAFNVNYSSLGYRLLIRCAEPAPPRSHGTFSLFEKIQRMPNTSYGGTSRNSTLHSFP